MKVTIIYSPDMTQERYERSPLLNIECGTIMEDDDGNRYYWPNEQAPELGDVKIPQANKGFLDVAWVGYVLDVDYVEVQGERYVTGYRPYGRRTWA